MVDFSTVLQFIQAGGIIVGVTYYILNIENNRKSQTIAAENQQHQLETRQAQLYMSIFNTINNQEIWKHIQEIWKHIQEIRKYEFQDYQDFMEKYGPITNPEEFDKLTKVWWLFTEMGSLVYRDYITLYDCSHLMGSAPLEIWSKYEDVIEGLRSDYFASSTAYSTFEYLAKIMYENFESGDFLTSYSRLQNAIPDVSIPRYSEISKMVRSKLNQ